MGRSFLFVALTAGALCAAPAAAQSGKGPLGRAIERHIHRLDYIPPEPVTESATPPTAEPLTTSGAEPAATSGAEPATTSGAEPAIATASSDSPAPGWGQVRKLPRGIEFHLRSSSGADGRRHLVAVAADTLTVLNLSHPGLSGSVRKQLVYLAREQLAALLEARHQGLLTYRDVTVGLGVVAVSGRRVATLDEVLQTIPRQDVREIRIRRVHGSTWGAIGGATAGVFGALALAPMLMMKPCGGSCSDERFLLSASLVGLPVGGALLGYMPQRHDLIVYRSSGTDQP